VASIRNEVTPRQSKVRVIDILAGVGCRTQTPKRVDATVVFSVLNYSNVERAPKVLRS
jgi:hypothetical protein